jgi:predicted ATPase/class 3 adenylate cyclase
VAGLPKGTVTFLFTDIEGSTRLLHELGDAYAAALAEHRLVLREAFARHGGVEVDTQGDAFFIVFSRAAAALAAASHAQRALGNGPVRVRMGVHTGEPLVTDEGYVGIDVHRAARIAAVGHGGQVLVSQSTRELVGADGLRDLGEHRLKDLTAPERIFQLGDTEFPPLKSLNATNLPVAANPLVGRKRELGELVALLTDSTRLVTLTGAGGTGKTRLGLQTAAELVERFPGGVFFVPLAGLRQPELVAWTITTIVGVHELAEFRDREALLLVDNFEHVLEAAPVVSDLLASSSRTRVLATSRAPLRIDGEREYPLDPLPDDDAVTLLTERARAVRPGFTPDEAAREVCRRLDGLPLALELAASRLRSLGSNALLERLERRLPLLTSGRRDAPERQRTLRATIGWSYDLMNPELRRQFARLAVFAGTFSVEAAESVAEVALDDLDALVDVSLLKPVGEDRFLMLETIREFASERLEASGEAAEIQPRHAEFFAEIAERANLTVEAEGPQNHQLARANQNDLRAALAWAVSANCPEEGLRIAVALENFWVTTDPLEGMHWFETLLARAEDVPRQLRARAIRCYGGSTTMAGKGELGERLYEQSLAELRALGDEQGVGILLHRLGFSAATRGDTERARELAEQSLELDRKTGFRKGETQALSLLGDLERRGGSLERALQFYERSLAVAREIGFDWWEKNVLLDQAVAFLALQQPGDALHCAREALAVANRMGDGYGTIDSLLFVARGALEDGDAGLAGVVWGALERETERAPVPGWEQTRDRWAGKLLEESDLRFESSRAAGRALSLDEAIRIGLETSDA